MQTVFRYPGSKSSLAPVLLAALPLQNAHHYIEPFVGGGSSLLAVAAGFPHLMLHANDSDNAIAAFWRVLTDKRESQRLSDKIASTVPTVALHSALQPDLNDADTLKAAYAALVVNRTSHNGRIGAGAIGGANQTGVNAVGCRFNAVGLAKRVMEIHGLLGTRLQVSHTDFAKYIKQKSRLPFSVLYCDPPYYEMGSTLYREVMEHERHKELSEILQALDMPWYCSYDDHPLIRNFYRNSFIGQFSTVYWMTGPRRGSELLISNSERVRELSMAKKKLEGFKRGRVGPEEIEKIKAMNAEGKTIEEISQHFNRSHPVIGKVISGKANQAIVGAPKAKGRPGRKPGTATVATGSMGGVDAHIREIVKQEVQLALKNLRIVSFNGDIIGG